MTHLHLWLVALQHRRLPHLLLLLPPSLLLLQLLLPPQRERLWQK